MQTDAKRRYDRLAKAKERRSNRSYKTELENALLLLALESTDLSEGQVARAMGLDRLAVRVLRDAAVAAGVELAEGLRRKSTVGVA